MRNYNISISDIIVKEFVITHEIIKYIKLHNIVTKLTRGQIM